MALKYHIRRNDIVTATAGSSASGDRTGKVLQILRGKGRAVVEGFNMVTKHLRKSQENPKGSIIKKEASIAVANLMLSCPHCKKGVRIAHVRKENGKTARTCKKCGHSFDG